MNEWMKTQSKLSSLSIQKWTLCFPINISTFLIHSGFFSTGMSMGLLAGVGWVGQMVTWNLCQLSEYLSWGAKLWSLLKCPMLSADIFFDCQLSRWLPWFFHGTWLVGVAVVALWSLTKTQSLTFVDLSNAIFAHLNLLVPDATWELSKQTVSFLLSTVGLN